MEGNTVNPANPQRRQLVLVLKPPEFALDGSAATVAGVVGLTNGERTRVVEALTGDALRDLGALTHGERLSPVLS